MRLGKALARTRETLVPHPWLIPLSLVTGALSGAMAIAFYASLLFATRWLLGPAGFAPATIAGDASGFHEQTGFAHPWAIPLVAAAGAFIAALAVFRIAPETEGHGTDAAIKAIHHHPAGIKWRAVPVKMVASAITLGSGGSGGSEGPIAQIAASASSVLAGRLKLDYARARIIVASGLAAGVGAIFRAPIGGAVLGAELLFQSGFDLSVLLTSAIASGVAYAEFSAVFGFRPMFGSLLGTGIGPPAHFAIFVVLGLGGGLLSRLYVRTFDAVAAISGRWRSVGRWRVPRAVKPGVGGLLTGLIGVFVPGVLGTGYGAIQDITAGDRVLGLSLAILIAMPFAKILATALSVGSGGSGGVFGPGMVIGASAGAALWRITQLPQLPWLHGLAPSSPAALVIVGIAACLGPAARAPVAIALIAIQTSGDWRLAVPMVLAVPLAVRVSGRTTLYKSQPLNRAALRRERARNPDPDRGAGAPSPESADQEGQERKVSTVNSVTHATGVTHGPLFPVKYTPGETTFKGLHLICNTAVTGHSGAPRWRAERRGARNGDKQREPARSRRASPAYRSDLGTARPDSEDM